MTGPLPKGSHVPFIYWLCRFGTDFAAIAKFVGTRSSTQVRTHAQKYYAKLVWKMSPSWLPSKHVALVVEQFHTYLVWHVYYGRRSKPSKLEVPNCIIAWNPPSNFAPWVIVILFMFWDLDRRPRTCQASMCDIWLHMSHTMYVIYSEVYRKLQIRDYKRSGKAGAATMKGRDDMKGLSPG